MRLASLALLLAPLAASAQDPARGRALYETHCGGCHYERVHDRLRSAVRDLADLRDMVGRWAPQTRRTYTLDELEDIVQYLNESHYRFGLPAAERPGTHRHGFGDAEKWAHVFDDPKRDAWQKPHEVIQALALKPDARVADLGAGTGYFAARLANMLPKATIYAVDIEPDMVKYLGERARREGLPNLKPVAASADDARLPEKMDLVLLVDVYHHIEDRSRYFRKLAASLRPGGRLAVIDFRLDAPEGPPRASRVAPERVKAELAQAGYALREEHGFLPHQYFLVFSPR